VGASRHFTRNASGTVASQTAAIPPAGIRPQTFTWHPHLIMQTPTIAQIQTAIEVLKKFGEHITHNATNLVIQLPDTRFGDHVAARAKVLNIEQVTRIQTVARQLEKWSNELLQQRRQCVSHHV
jgi:hypothetical protein